MLCLQDHYLIVALFTLPEHLFFIPTMSEYLNKPFPPLPGHAAVRSRKPVPSQASRYVAPQSSRIFETRPSLSVDSKSPTSTTHPSDSHPSARAQDHITRTESVLRRIRKAKAEIGHTMRLLKTLYKQCLHECLSENPNLSQDSFEAYYWPRYLTESREFRQSGCSEKASMLSLMYDSGLGESRTSGGCDSLGSPIDDGYRVSTFWVTNRAGVRTPASSAGFTPRVSPYSGRSAPVASSERLSVLGEQYEQEVADAGFHPLILEIPARIDAAEIVGGDTEPMTSNSWSSNDDINIDTALSSPLPSSLRPGTFVLPPDHRAEQTTRSFPTRKPVPSQRLSTETPSPSTIHQTRAPSTSSQQSALPLSLRPGTLIAPADGKAQQMTTTVPSRKPVGAAARAKRRISDRAPQHPPIPYTAPFDPYEESRRVSYDTQRRSDLSRTPLKTPVLLSRPATPDFEPSTSWGGIRASGVFPDPLCIEDEIRMPYLDELCLTRPPSPGVGFFDGVDAVDLRIVMASGDMSRRQRAPPMSYF